MKFVKVVLNVCILSFIFMLSVVPSSSYATPAPDIKANNTDSVVSLDTSDTLTITVSLDAGTSEGLNADWWIVADTPFGWYYYVYPNGWYYAPDLSDLEPAYQGALFTLGPVEVLNISGLPAGTYIFYFGVDDIMNGQLDLSDLYFDGVVVNISTAINLTGTWVGFWDSDEPGYSGGVTLNLVQEDNTISGIATITNSYCISGGTISGNVEATTVVFGVGSATEGGTILFSGIFTSTTMSGTYGITSGECAGDTGAFSLTKQ